MHGQGGGKETGGPGAGGGGGAGERPFLVTNAPSLSGQNRRLEAT